MNSWSFLFKINANLFPLSNPALWDPIVKSDKPDAIEKLHGLSSIWKRFGSSSLVSMKELPPLRNILMGFSLIIWCECDFAPTSNLIPELSAIESVVFLEIPIRIHCSNKSAPPSSSELKSSCKISLGSGSAGGDLIAWIWEKIAWLFINSPKCFNKNVLEKLWNGI